MVWIKEIEWDKNNDWKPLRHGISLEEVEEALFNGPMVRKSHSFRYVALGQTDAGQYIVVAFESKPDGVIRPITARPMQQDERRLYERERG